MSAVTPANEDKSPDEQLTDLLATADPDKEVGTDDTDESQSQDAETDETDESKTGEEEGSDAVIPSDVEQLTDEQIDAIEDPALKKLARDLRSGFHRKMSDLSDRERGLEDRASRVRYAERAHQAALDGKPEEAISILRDAAAGYAREGNLQPAGPSAQAPGAIDAEKLRELYANAPEDVRLVLDAVGALSQQVTELGGSVQKHGSQLRTRAEADAEQTIKRDIADLEKQYGARFDVDEAELIAYCNKHGLVDVKTAFFVKNFDGAVKASEKAKVVTRGKKRKLPQDESSLRSSQAGPAGTIEEIWAEAEREAGAPG